MNFPCKPGDRISFITKEMVTSICDHCGGIISREDKDVIKHGIAYSVCYTITLDTNGEHVTYYARVKEDNGDTRTVPEQIILTVEKE